MDTKHLHAVEKTTLLLAAVVTAVAILALDRRMAFGVVVGAGLMALNAWALRRIADRMKITRRPGATILLFNLKMALLIALVFAIIHFLHVDGVGLVIGISTFPAAIVVVAVRHALGADAPPESPEQPSDPTEGDTTHG
jgi:hypothetical protein